MPYVSKLMQEKCFVNNTHLAFRGENFAIPQCTVNLLGTKMYQGTSFIRMKIRKFHESFPWSSLPCVRQLHNICEFYDYHQSLVMKFL